MFAIENNGLVRNIPVIFPDILVHKEVAERVGSCKMLRGVAKPVSAGFVQFGNGGKVQAFGESESLGLASRPQDSEIITTYDYFGGVEA